MAAVGVKTDFFAIDVGNFDNITICITELDGKYKITNAVHNLRFVCAKINKFCAVDFHAQLAGITRFDRIAGRSVRCGFKDTGIDVLCTDSDPIQENTARDIARTRNRVFKHSAVQSRTTTECNRTCDRRVLREAPTAAAQGQGRAVIRPARTIPNRLIVFLTRCGIAGVGFTIFADFQLTVTEFCIQLQKIGIPIFFVGQLYFAQLKGDAVRTCGGVGLVVDRSQNLILRRNGQFCVICANDINAGHTKIMIVHRQGIGGLCTAFRIKLNLIKVAGTFHFGRNRLEHAAGNLAGGIVCVVCAQEIAAIDTAIIRHFSIERTILDTTTPIRGNKTIKDATGYNAAIRHAVRISVSGKGAALNDALCIA